MCVKDLHSSQHHVGIHTHAQKPQHMQTDPCQWHTHRCASTCAHRPSSSSHSFQTSPEKTWHRERRRESNPLQSSHDICFLLVLKNSGPFLTFSLFLSPLSFSAFLLHPGKAPPCKCVRPRCVSVHCAQGMTHHECNSADPLYPGRRKSAQGPAVLTILPTALGLWW